MASPSANKAELEQKVCQQFGWSSRYYRTDETPAGCWAVEVRTGCTAADSHTFVTEDSSPNTKKGAKQGHRTAATQALAGLAPLVAAELAKPLVNMEDLFAAEFAGVRVLDSSEAAWAELAALNGPAGLTVGIDVEGNLSFPPVLVQVASTVGNLVILEAPEKEVGLSAPLAALLADPSVRKIFCDGPGHADKTSLGLRADAAEAPGEGPFDGHIIELEHVTNALAGRSGTLRGLARVLGLGLPQVGVRVTKEKNFDDVALFAGIDQGMLPPLAGVEALPAASRRYAAMDAWCTARAWEGLISQPQPGATAPASASSPLAAAAVAVPPTVNLNVAAAAAFLDAGILSGGHVPFAAVPTPGPTSFYAGTPQEANANANADLELPAQAPDGAGGLGLGSTAPSPLPNQGNTNPNQMPGNPKDPVMELMELCQQHSWPAPAFTEQPTATPQGSSQPRFQWSVSISGCPAGMDGILVTGNYT